MKTLDVSQLPSGDFGHRAPIWWGNLLLLTIESVMFGLLIAAYFYYRQNIEPWPPPQVLGEGPRLLEAEPALGVPTLNLLVLLVAIVPTVLADRAALKLDRAGVIRWDSLSLACLLLAIILRWFEFDALHFRWDENAYASIVWFILGMHLVHMLVVLLEEGNTLVWVLRRGLDKKHALDMRVSTVYYYWVVGTWVVLYPVLYLVPRLL